MNRIKHFSFHVTGMIILVIMLLPVLSRAQVLNETTKKRIGIGIGMITDIWQNVPGGVKSRTINQGFHAYVLYSVPFGKSRFGFGVGLGISVHNLYGNFTVSGKNDTTKFVKIPDSVSYKRSKISLPYLELPIEFHYTSKGKFALGVGFKVGYLVGASTKYVGDDIQSPHEGIWVKERNLKNLDYFAYGPYLRIGYKWFHLYGYYQLSEVFKKGVGPAIAPITLGFLIRPF